MPIIYKKGDLFTEPDLNKKIIVHACNGKGVWGRGFALTCKEKFPILYKDYQKSIDWRQSFVDKAVKEFPFPKHFGGEAPLIYDGNQTMRCLITSHEYIKEKLDTKQQILENTRKALVYLVKNHKDSYIYVSPKFNSGLFGVPWEETEAILKEVLEGTDIEWIVYEPERK